MILGLWKHKFQLYKREDIVIKEIIFTNPRSVTMQ